MTENDLKCLALANGNRKVRILTAERIEMEVKEEYERLKAHPISGTFLAYLRLTNRWYISTLARNPAVYTQYSALLNADGTIKSILFSEQPCTKKNAGCYEIDISLRDPKAVFKKCR